MDDARDHPHHMHFRGFFSQSLAVTKLIDAGRLPHLLFYGPPGTGKTTTILAIARKLYGNNFNQMVLELNASDDRGIDVVREQIKDFASTRKLFSSGVKLVILDEADAMTADAQFALRRVIEKFTKTTRFCMICNYVSKIIPALQSRCTRFRFAPLAKQQISSRLSYIIDKEGLSSRVTEDGTAAILRLANGDMRKVLNVLQATASGFDTISAETVYACTGNPPPSEIEAVLKSLLTDDFQKAYESEYPRSHRNGDASTDARTLIVDSVPHPLSFLRRSSPSSTADLSAMSTLKGLALADILTELSRTVSTMTLKSEVRALLLERFADIEYRLAFGTSEKLQAAALVGAFAAAREMLVPHAPGAKA